MVTYTGRKRPCIASEHVRAVGMLDTAGNADVRWCSWITDFSLLPIHLLAIQEKLRLKELSHPAWSWPRPQARSRSDHGRVHGKRILLYSA